MCDSTYKYYSSVSLILQNFYLHLKLQLFISHTFDQKSG